MTSYTRKELFCDEKECTTKNFSVFMVLIILCSNFPIVVNASNNDFYAQYSASTDAS